MNLWTLALRSLWHHRRVNLAVALGMAIATAVLTGALLVGDSMRASLHRLVVERLGRVDGAFSGSRFFRTELAVELAAEPAFQTWFDTSVPVILLEASVAQPDRGTRAHRVTTIGCDDRFWRLATSSSPQGIPTTPPEHNQVVLNRPLADELGVHVGEDILLRATQPGDIPADSPLGRKTETIRSRRLTVAAICPAEGLGRFSLQASQQLPLNAFVAIDTLGAMLDRPGRANTLLLAGRDDVPRTNGYLPAESDGVQDAARPTLDDFGLRMVQAPAGYLQVSSDQMLLEAPLVRAVHSAARDPHAPPDHAPSLAVQPVLTYLANSLRCADREIPYSTVAALDFAVAPPLGPFVDAAGMPVPPLADGQIALNRWAADQLQAHPGDAIQLTYFEPESTHGQVREQTVSLTLSAIVELTGAAADPLLTPELKGVTDQQSIADWDPPFPFDANRIRPEDENYWDQYRATPKAFVSLATGRRLWGSRFGDTTSLRLAPAADGDASPLPTPAEFAKRLELPAKALGFAWQPVRRQQLEAAAGTTPFSGLFIGFSFFIIASAVMLVALLFRLGVETRASQWGLLAALGLSTARIRRVLLLEALVVSFFAALVGVAAGVSYAALMLAGLRTWWLAAISTPFLKLAVTPQSLLAGFASGVAVGMATVGLVLRRLLRWPPRQLLAGQTAERTPTAPRRVHWPFTVAAGTAFAAAGLAAFGTQRTGIAQAGLFFGSGALVLIAALATIWSLLLRCDTAAAIAAGPAPLVRLAFRNAARNPLRSALTIALVAAACFLIAALSAFRQDPTQSLPTRRDGTGGFALWAASDQPIYGDLNTPAGRQQAGTASTDATTFDSVQLYGCRVRPGDDASCLNLYQPRDPRVLGLPSALIERGGFAWSAHGALSASEAQNPWRLLERTLPAAADGTPQVPVVIDQNTATYSLHLGGLGDAWKLTDDAGQPLRLVVVGLLQNSILQGDLLIGERHFLQHFPRLSGYRLWLIDAPPERAAQVAQQLETDLADYGLDAQRTTHRLAGFLAVQNTYLSTFQSLGGLGLLLGTLGLAAVQLRNVLERRSELALLRAAGFRSSRLVQLVLCEHLLLLVAGLATGLLAAVVAISPHLTAGAALVPWQSLAGTLLMVLAVGLASGWWAARATLRAPLIPALRGD